MNLRYSTGYIAEEINPALDAWVRLIHRFVYWGCNRSPFRVGSKFDQIIYKLTKKIYPNRLKSTNSIAMHLFGHIAWRLLPKLTGTILCPTHFKFKLFIDNECGTAYYLFGYYELGTLNLIKRVLNENDVFFDIGASVGQMSLFASEIVGDKGKVFAFEPAEIRNNYLSKSVRYNQKTNIKVFKNALGSMKGEAFLDSSNYISPTMIGVTRSTATESVAVLTLDDVVADENIGVVNLIKLDVEGSELDVLEGASKLISSESPPVICFEYGVLGTDRKIIDYLLSCNQYRFFKFKDSEHIANVLEEVRNYDSLNTATNLIACVKKHSELLPEIEAAFI